MTKIIGLWNGSISGEFTTIIDLFYNLKKYIDIEFHLCVKNKNLISNCIRHLIQNNNYDLLSNITLETEFKSNLIICTSFLLYNNISLNSSNLFVLDSLDLVRNNYITPNLKHDNILFFCNPANITNKIPYKQIEYYHKFSYNRLNNLPKYYRSNLLNGKSELFLLDNYNYCRMNKPFIEIKPGAFFENIGKRIFEHLYHGKNVNYSHKGFTNPDGLFYYLKLFGINGNKSCNLKIIEHIIKEKLFMSENDELLTLIREL